MIPLNKITYEEHLQNQINTTKKHKSTIKIDQYGKDKTTKNYKEPEIRQDVSKFTKPMKFTKSKWGDVQVPYSTTDKIKQETFTKKEAESIKKETIKRKRKEHEETGKGLKVEAVEGIE